MKKITLGLLIVFSFLTSLKAIAQQGFGTNQPDKSAAVDIVSSKRGLLIPRLALTSTTSASPVNSPAESLLVYNTAIAGDVTPGYYFWQNGAWVRFVSAANDKTATVTAGDNITVTPNVTGNTTDYEVSVRGSATDGQVLVTQVVGGVTTTVWVDPSTFVQNVTASNGLTIDASDVVKLGGALNETLTTIATGTNDLAITGLENVSGTFNSATQNIVVMGIDGVLKLVSPQTLVRANETVTIFRNNADGTFTYFSESEIDAAGNVITSATGVTIDTNASALEYVNTTSGLTAANVQDAIDELAVTITNTKGDLTVAGGIEFTGVTNGTDKLLGDAGIQIADDGVTASKLANNAVTTDKIADGGVTNVKIADGAVSADKMTSFTTANGTANPAASGTVPVADGSGNVTYQNVSTAIGNDLTTDGIIVIGTGESSLLEDAVLVPTALKIKDESITTTQILNGTITSTDIANKTIEVGNMADAGVDQVLVTDASGEATWINQTALPNTTTADNGLTKTGNNIQLGGALIQATQITTTTPNTLAIQGLENSAANSAAIVLAESSGVLRKVARSLEFDITGSTVVTSLTGYNKFVQEITIFADIGSADIDITLPTASDAKGQVINVKIANTTEPNFYVNIAGVDGTTIYGAMPYQGWIIKSNGTSWSVVGRH